MRLHHILSVLALLGAAPQLVSAQGAPPAQRELVTGQASMEVPVGSIRVTVVDQAGAPVNGAEVNVGLMGAGGARDRLRQRTDATGRTTFSGRATGAVEAYRVNLPFEGALYSSTPFRLPTTAGFEVRITRLPTTRDPTSVLLVHGELSVEFREARLHLVQSIELMNLGQATFVFPEAGQPLVLPPGFTGQQTEAVMTDQKLLTDAQGYRIHGSLPPGSVVLTWGYDLPRAGAQQVIELPVPFRTYSYRVISEAPEGGSLDVEAVSRGAGAAGAQPSQFSRTQVVESEGKRLWLADLERTAQDPPLQSVRLQFSGLPTPGPLRWYAAVGALLLAIAGVYVAVNSGGAQSGDALATRRVQVLDALEALELQRTKDEVGPKTYEQERERLMTDLAAVVRAEERRPAEAKRPSARAAKPPVSSTKDAASR